MTVRFPEMRVNLEEGLRALVELGERQGDEAARRHRWPGLTEGINWLDDNAPEPAASSVGATLRDDEEARLVQRVHDAWNAVLSETADRGGPTAPDDVHIAASSWPNVTAAAADALQRLETADAGENS
jgi:hypothetical protein